MKNMHTAKKYDISGSKMQQVWTTFSGKKLCPIKPF